MLKNVKLVLAANKQDIRKWEVKNASGEELASQHGMWFYETTASTGSNINVMLERIARESLNHRQLANERPLHRGFTIKHVFTIVFWVLYVVLLLLLVGAI